MQSNADLILNKRLEKKRKYTIVCFGGNLKVYLMSFHQALGHEYIYVKLTGNTNRMESFYEISGYP